MSVHEDHTAEIGQKEPARIEKPVLVKKGVLTVILAAVSMIVGLILIGLNGLNHRTDVKRGQTSASVNRVADTGDTGWYQDRKAETLKPVSKPTPVKTAQTTKTVAQTMPSSVALPQDASENKATEALQKAMQAPISAQQITAQADFDAHREENAQKDIRANPPGEAIDPSADPNGQASKKAFLKASEESPLKDYLTSSLQKPLSPYELQAGSLIPGILLTGVNSDLPGMITGQVRENVYDSISGNFRLIPQGSKIVGVYDAQVAYGQERVLIAWQRIIFPNGESLNLQGMPGTDISGYAGFHDQTNNHYAKVFGSVVLMSLLSAGGQLSQPQNQAASVFTANAANVNQTIAQSLGTNIASTATQMTQKNLNIQPTLEIRPGYEFNIMVTKDMVFPSVYQG